MMAVVLMTSVSMPMRSIAAAAFWSLAGDITEASPPPIAEAAARGRSQNRRSVASLSAA
jgi:hypothetical protein